jgi:Zn-dependent membrane protease YugP
LKHDTEINKINKILVARSVLFSLITNPLLKSASAAAERWSLST